MENVRYVFMIGITKFSDKYRKESFPETFPQLYELIKEDWDDGEV